jgi:hypothetical protein
MTSPTERTGISLRACILLAGAITLCAAAWRLSARKPVATPQPAAAAPMPIRLQPEELSPAEADREAPTVESAYRR